MDQEYIIDSADGGRKLKDYLLKKLNLSRRSIIDLKKNYGTCINGKPMKVDTILKEGDRVRLLYPDPKESFILPEEMPMDILYEDEWLILLNKSADMPVHPCRNYPTGTLANGLMRYYEELGRKGTIHPITRLDKGTSGITLFAKDPHVQHLLNLEEYRQSFKKEYFAIYSGRMLPDRGLIDLPIGRLEEGKVRRGIMKDGAPSRTEYRNTYIREEVGYSGAEVILHTGRTHQIRVHFAHLGHPLLGDELYGGDLSKLSHQALHARRISFTHPILKIDLKIEAPLPADLQDLLV